MSNTKEHILNVTFRLFLQKSFKEVTLKEIVEETGLSKGAFYHYFTSKEQLFLELVNNVFSTFIEIPYEQFNKDSLYNFYIDYINYHLKFNQGNHIPSFNYISLVFDAIRLFPDFKERFRKSKEIQLNSWKEIIYIARKKGEINSSMNDEQIANMFINSSNGIETYRDINTSNEEIYQSYLNLWDSFYNELKL